MTVAELIKKLQQCNPNADVYVHDFTPICVGSYNLVHVDEDGAVLLTHFPPTNQDKGKGR